MVVDTVLTILSSAWLGPLAKKIASFGGTKRKGKAQELAKIGDVFSGGRVDKRSASTITIRHQAPY